MIDWGRWWRRDDPLIDTLIKPPVAKYAGADEALAQQTQARRDAAVRRRRVEASGRRADATTRDVVVD